MIYNTESKFSYGVDGVTDAINDRIFFDNVKPEHEEIIKQYYALINAGKINEAVTLINNSKINVFNASLFNALKNRIAKIQEHYINKYWDSENNKWSDRDSSESSFLYRNNNTLPTTTEDPITYTKITDYTDLYLIQPVDIDTQPGKLIQPGKIIGDFMAYQCGGLEVAYENNNNYVYTYRPITLERGRYEIGAYIPDINLRKKFANKNIIYSFFADVWNNKSEVKLLEGEVDGYGQTVTVANALENLYMTYDENGEGNYINITDIHDNDYEDIASIDEKFNLCFSFELPNGVSVTDFNNYIQNEDIMIMIIRLD